MCQLAQTYSDQGLVTSCAKFIVEKVKDVDWGVVEKAPVVALAMAKHKHYVKHDAESVYKELKDFVSKEEYGAYVKRVIKEGMKVRRRVHFVHWAMEGAVGDMGKIDRVNVGHTLYTLVKWEGGPKQCFIESRLWSLDLVSPSSDD